jgi:plasmid rolling circle replication initiator protein Rep
MKNRTTSKSEKEQFNTIAQLRTNKSFITMEGPVIINGKGSDLTDENMQKNRCKKKIITHTLILNLIDIAKKKKNTALVKSLWNTYNCQKVIVTHKERAYSKYCKNRFCTVCLGIRKAELINTYYPILKQWEKPYFVTLTAKAVPAIKLNARIPKMIRGLNLIIDRNKKRHIRNNAKKLIGVRSLECNFNPKSLTYNPHFHLIVRDKETAEILVKEWLELLTTKFARRKAQHYKEVDNLGKALIEIIKYGTKVFTTPKEDEPVRQKNSVVLYVKAFYNILVAMKTHRLFGSFGLKIPKTDKGEKTQSKTTTDHEKWIYNPKSFDWENMLTKEKLNDYEPSDELVQLLFTDKIDLTRE